MSANASSSRSTPPPPPRTGTPSYSTVGEKDLEAIGAHCHYTYCNQLDFLPFRCESCKYTYCLDHRTETAHQCSKAGAWAAARRKANNAASSTTASSALDASGTSSKPTLATATQCSDPSCKTFINTGTSLGVTCSTCQRAYCLKHRMPDSHSCSTLSPLGVGRSGAKAASTAATQAQKAQAALSRLRLWGREKAAAAATATANATSSKRSTRTSAAAAATARSTALNNLKKTAKGDAKVPVDKRTYLYVEAEATTTSSKLPKGDFFFNADWSVGRMLDEAAKGLQVENVNNRGGGEEERLRVFHVEGGRVLEFGEKVGKVCGLGDTVVLLRGVGAATDLIEM